MGLGGWKERYTERERKRWMYRGRGRGREGSNRGTVQTRGVGKVLEVLGRELKGLE